MSELRTLEYIVTSSVLFFPGDVAMTLRQVSMFNVSSEQRCVQQGNLKNKWWKDFKSVKPEIYVIILEVDATLTQHSVFVMTQYGILGWIATSALLKLD